MFVSVSCSYIIRSTNTWYRLPETRASDPGIAAYAVSTLKSLHSHLHVLITHPRTAFVGDAKDSITELGLFVLEHDVAIGAAHGHGLLACGEDD